MSKTAKSRLTRALTELPIIVLGVMIALGADQWRQSLDDETRKREYLGSLRVDLLNTIASMNGADSTLIDRLDRASRFLDVITASTPVPDGLLELAPGTVGFVVERGTLDAFVEGGAIDLIDDPVLRSLILTERARIASYDRVLARVHGPWFQQTWSEWLKARASIRPEAAQYRGPEIPASEYVGRTDLLGIYANHHQFLVNRRFQVGRIRASAERLLAGLPAG